MRNLVVVTILCLTSTPTFACVVDTDCKPGFACLDSTCGIEHRAGEADDDVPMKRAATGKSCFDDGDCSQGSHCIKGSGPEGVCIGH
jgi:hypothetical protein